MKISKVQVTEFQSIRDSNPFDVGDITCLVGKNESGKTALLQALYRLNPIIPEDGRYDVTDDYPRADVEDYQQDIDAGRTKSAIVVRATFTLTDSEIENIESELGKGVLETPEVTLCRNYENNTVFRIRTNEGAAAKGVISAAQLPEALADKLSSATNLEDLTSLADAETDEEVSEHISRLKSQLKKIQEANGLANFIYRSFIQSLLPKFLYFDEYFMMKGHENIETLKTRLQQRSLEKSDYPLLGLIELARIELDELLNPQRTEWLVNKLEGASNHLSKKVLKYWSQNRHLQMKFDVRPARPGDPPGMTTGTNIWARVHDTRRMVSTPLGTRSRGFVWFFSFLAWFDQQQRNNQPLILLLDEPGLFLHGRAQADLLRYIEEELHGNHQVIYTTHSPFMVDPTKFERVRIVQDKSMDTDEALPDDHEGTKVIIDVLEATEDSLFPLQGALGYDLYQTLFVGPNNLVVEGVSDLLYIQTLSTVLSSEGRTSLSEKWTITPVGGADKVPTFVALLGAQRGLRVATLIDVQSKDQQTIENLYRRKLLRRKNVLTFADFTGTSEADIEDMFGLEFYIELINREYASDLSGSLVVTSIKGRTPRILVRLQDHFAKNPLKNNLEFNHFRPARHLAENVAELRSLIPNQALDRFENAFQAINALI